MAFRKKMFERYGSFRTDLGPRPDNSIRSEDTEFGRRVLNGGEELYYEPAAVVYHPVTPERLTRKYFLQWWFDKGRADALEFPEQDGRALLGIPLYLIKRIVGDILRWTVALESVRRFDCKRQVWGLAGEITERYRRTFGKTSEEIEEDTMQVVTEKAAVAQRPILTIRRPGLWSPFSLGEVWSYRDLLWALAVRDVKLRYRQTALGVVWVVLQPLLAAGIMSFVFGFIAKLPSDGLPYFLLTYTGMLGWQAFNSTLTKASSCIVGNAQLVSKVYFPRLILPLSTVLSTLLDFLVGFVLLLVLMGHLRYPATGHSVPLACSAVTADYSCRRCRPLGVGIDGHLS